MNKAGVIFLSFFLILFWNIPTSAQDIVLKLADGLFDVGNYGEAITEYKRFLYFNPEDRRISDIYYKIGLAYRHQGNWQEALDAFRKSIVTADNDSLQDERRISVGILLIVSKKYSAAELTLLRISFFSKYPSLRQKASFFLGVCYLYKFKWEEARKALNKYFSNSNVQKDQVEILLMKANKLRYKSPTLAKWLSTFIPGSGQIYAGDWKMGINALVINSLTTYLLVNALLEKRYQDVVLTHLTLFERYYRGNRFHAERIARLHNENLNRKFAQKILDRLTKINSHHP